MHDIEPYFRWRENYVSSEDSSSPFYGRQYSEFQYSQKIYNYFIHPQWDYIGSPTLYAKQLFTDYLEGYTIIELLGEWNDCINNDVTYLKREIIDHILKQDISKYIILCDNVMNFHSDDDCYYEEWYDDVKDEDGWVCFINTREHVLAEMNSVHLKNYVMLGDEYNEILWQKLKPRGVYEHIQTIMSEYA